MKFKFNYDNKVFLCDFTIKGKELKVGCCNVNYKFRKFSFGTDVKFDYDDYIKLLKKYNKMENKEIYKLCKSYVIDDYECEKMCGKFK